MRVIVPVPYPDDGGRVPAFICMRILNIYRDCFFVPGSICGFYFASSRRIDVIPVMVRGQLSAV